MKIPLGVVRPAGSRVIEVDPVTGKETVLKEEPPTAPAIETVVESVDTKNISTGEEGA